MAKYINAKENSMFVGDKTYKELPIIDMVEVVRCKDCKWRKFIDWGMGDCLHPKGSKHIAYDYHYCSYGERRENDKSTRA